jgi:hypothetical protein
MIPPGSCSSSRKPGESDVEPAVELEEPLEAAEMYAEMMARIWRQPGRRPAPFRERSVDPADGHRHSDPVGPYQPLSSWSSPGRPGAYAAESRPSIGEPTD